MVAEVPYIFDVRITSLKLKDVGPFDDTTITFPKGERDDLADVYLLVGQNGCGKTALHMLAALIAPDRTEDLRVARRFIGEESLARVEDDQQMLWALGPQLDRGFATERTPDRARELGLYANGGQAGMTSFVKPPGFAQGHPVEVFRSGIPSSRRAVGWAAFSYAGARSVADTRVASIAEISDAPLMGALGFAATADSQRLAQWIANQHFQRLKAKDAGAAAQADAIEESIRRIERAIADIIGDTFSFEHSLSDLDVRVRLAGGVIDFGLLPEGLKSIVSWLADLLMRLERTPWADDTPVLQREFLLLLDEIDVHLHPTWQRKVLPVVQRLFPNAQIIASTHSPFVVASLADGAVIELKLDERGRATAQEPKKAPLRLSYRATLKDLFGINSDFDFETEQKFAKFHDATERALRGDGVADSDVKRLAEELQTSGGEEVAQIVQFELNQLARLKKAAR